MIFILDFGDAPAVLAALDDTAVGGLDVFLRADHGEWHSGQEGASVLSRGLVVFFDGWGVDLNALSVDNSSNLGYY